MKEIIESSTFLKTMNDRVKELLEKMTLDEKIGQLSLVNGSGGIITDELRQSISDGAIGGIINEVDPEINCELQRIANENSRLGIPLLIGRDIIHGFNTIFPIPIGLASSFNREIVKQCGKSSALEASSKGVNWTFAPMVDISRDPRWGRVAESFGEDTYLSCEMAKEMVRGFQGDKLEDESSIATCVKHFAGYGASEAGKDYNTTNVPENELRNVHLPPFKAAIDAGAVSVMTSFCDIDGVPATANQFLLNQVLRKEWKFDGFVVSDWASISQLQVHGLTANDKDSAFEAANAGVDMEMASTTYNDHLKELIEENKISLEQLDKMVSNILRIKFKLGLFKNTLVSKPKSNFDNSKLLQSAKQAALESCVLLENKNSILPLDKSKLATLAIIGPLADNKHEQLGTWVFDGSAELSQTPLDAINKFVDDDIKIIFVRVSETTRSNIDTGFKEAEEAAKKSDAVIMFLGEEAILSGEAHCLADISLQGYQEELIDKISATGKPIILVIMAGRPLLLQNIKDKVDAILYAWHPGSMAGPAVTDLIFGVESPSGKLPVTFPRVLGQIPIYYNHKNTGRPATPETIIRLVDIKLGAPQHSVGNTSFHLDVDNKPLYHFGYGLSYTQFKYSDLKLDSDTMLIDGSIKVSVDITNVGEYDAFEVVQLYIRDLVGSVTRPVKELKKFDKFFIKAGETKSVTFKLHAKDLAFYDRRNILTVEPGKFHLWVGGCSNTKLKAEFKII